MPFNLSLAARKLEVMSKKILRSQLSFGKKDQDGFIHRSWMKNQGLPDDVFDGRPVIGICNSASELTPCNAHLKEMAEYVKRGVWEAGGLPLEFLPCLWAKPYYAPPPCYFVI